MIFHDVGKSKSYSFSIFVLIFARLENISISRLRDFPTRKTLDSYHINTIKNQAATGNALYCRMECIRYDEGGCSCDQENYM